MKTGITFLLLLLIQIVTGKMPVTGNKSDWDHSVLNTAFSASYLSSLEKEIILEINKVRSNPSKYAKDYLLPLTSRYKNNFLYYPDDKPLKTKEGVEALNECIRYLKNQPSLPLVYPKKGLTRAAQDHVNDQSHTGQTGHAGSDRSGFRERIERYGNWKIRIAENIAYGSSSAQQIVIYLLIDDGIKNRGHRKNFLDPKFKTIGVATGSHPSYGTMAVMDFATDFR
jgi:uncharacterized protein YkwD